MGNFETEPMWSWPYRHKKTPQNTPADIDASKTMDENNSLLRTEQEAGNDNAKTQADTDINNHYGPENVVNDVISNGTKVDTVLKNIPPVNSFERKAYYDEKNWKYDDTIPKDELVDSVMRGKDIINEIVNPDTVNNNYSLEDYIDQVNLEFGKEAGLLDVSTFMKRMAATESNLGRDPLRDQSYSAFQIDPIKYRDIVEKALGGGEAGRRAEIANRFLRERLNDPSFDILNVLQGESVEGKGERYVPNEALRAHHPLIGATLARLGLANIKDDIPADENLVSQAGYWKKFWNTLSGKGDIMNFINKSKYHKLGE